MMESIVLKVIGMSCGGCVKSVTNVLQELPGVAKAEVSLEQGEAKVDFDPAKVTREAMAQAIADAGFEAG
jgi:copper chaperone